MVTKVKTESSDTIRTTATERKKAELIKRCFINILKCLRMCKKPRKDKKWHYLCVKKHNTVTPQITSVIIFQKRKTCVHFLCSFCEFLYSFWQHWFKSPVIFKRTYLDQAYLPFKALKTYTWHPRPDSARIVALLVPLQHNKVFEAED